MFWKSIHKSLNPRYFAYSCENYEKKDESLWQDFQTFFHWRTSGVYSIWAMCTTRQIKCSFCNYSTALIRFYYNCVYNFVRWELYCSSVRIYGLKYTQEGVHRLQVKWTTSIDIADYVPATYFQKTWFCTYTGKLFCIHLENSYVHLGVCVLGVEHPCLRG